MALTLRCLLFGATDAHVYDTPEAAKGGNISYAAPRKRERAQVPACAGTKEAFLAKCVGCQLCLKACRHHVLRASVRPGHFLKPELDFRLGWCPPECSRCGAACPAGALKPVDEPEKRQARLGVANWREANCLTTKGVACNACLRHCPMQAISPDEKGRPVVDKTKCNGCGACEFFCPARPATGMQVEGV